jgi:hypothetical protein
MNQAEFIDLMRKTAQDLGSDRLTREDFSKRSGVSRNEYAKHFDTWAEACSAAGLQTGFPVSHFAPNPYSREDCVEELRRIAALLGRNDLSSKTFSRHARFGDKVVRRAFGSWKNALDEAGLELTLKSKKNLTLPTREECVSEMKRVAYFLGQSYLTRRLYDMHSNINSQRVDKVFGSWGAALAAAEISLSPHYKREIPLKDLAGNFLSVVKELGKIPTLQQLARRTKPVSDTYSSSVRFGGYSRFKQMAIDFVLSSHTSLSPGIRTILEKELEKIGNHENMKSPDISIPPPHHQGRTLNFRAFAYAPTCEHDVVQLFGAIAHELDFEIIGNRSAFPDCEARRKIDGGRERYVKCLIEYEFSSRDYKKHDHPLEGCDLIVCWEHNWSDCPIEVLELSKAIRELDGWR